MSSNKTQSGFSLIEAMVATMIMGISFVGVYTLTGYSANSVKQSEDMQDLQIISNQIIESLRADYDNIADYDDMNLATCTEPDSSDTSTSSTNYYRWCRMLNDKVGTPTSTETRLINLVPENDGYIINLTLESRGSVVKLSNKVVINEI